jgi:raffinose/stachyose/melibiose transport system substrate-binding protein
MLFFRNNRRVALVGAMLTLVGGSLAACGGGGSSSSGHSIALWSEWTDGAAATGIASTIKEWDKAHPDWPVVQRSIPNDSFFAAVRTGMAGSTPPDVLAYEGYESTMEFGKADELTDLSSLWKTVASNVVQPNGPAVKGACSYQGKVYCVPWEWDNQSFLYYNESVMKQYNLSPPKTFSEMLQDAAILKSHNVIPFSLSDSDGWPGAHWYFEFLGQYCGADTVTSAVQQTGAKWNDPCFVKAADEVSNLVKLGYFPKGLVGEDYNAQVTLLKSGKAAMAEDGIWLYEPPADGIGGEIFPAVEGAPYDATSGWVGSTLGVPAKAKNKQMAEEFIKFMLSTPSVAAEWAKAGDPMSIKNANASLPQADADLVAQVQNKPQLPPADETLPFAVGNTQLYALGQSLLNESMTGQEFSDKLEAAAAKAGPGV